MTLARVGREVRGQAAGRGRRVRRRRARRRGRGLALETAGLTKQFAPGIGAIDLDLAVPRGTVYGFLGPKGAGKTTTPRMLAGSLRPDRGCARVLGLDPLGDALALRHRVGFLPSDAAFARHHAGTSLIACSAPCGAGRGRSAPRPPSSRGGSPWTSTGRPAI